MSESTAASAVTFEGVYPILRVRDLTASLDYYTRVLGFGIDWQAPGVIASVSRGRCGIFLCEGDQGHTGGWVWIGVSDVEAVHAEYVRAGATIRHPPASYSWAYEMQVADPDGDVLRIGSEPREDLPAGDWLDMDGRLWRPTPSGPRRVE